jgi:sulfide:quinone oxidoreductase
MRVVIAGGGVAGLEALLALSDLAEDLVDVELLSPNDEFVYRPLLAAEPFGAAEVLTVELERVARDAGARHTKDALIAIDPSARTVSTASGATLKYDALLIALGAYPVEAVPGALTFGGEAERRRFGELLNTLGRRGMNRIAFAVPRTVTWSIAAYELAFLTASECRARRLDGVEVVLVTHEAAPLDLFGGAASNLVASHLREAGVSVRTSAVAERFEEGELHLSAGRASSPG